MHIPKPLKRCIRLIPTVAMLLTSLILLSYASYSWIKRDWSSGIKQDGITIATGSTLAFVFTGDKTGGAVKDLKSLLGVENFQLKSVSNATGKGGDFYSLTPSPQGDAFATLNHLTWADLPSIGNQNDETKVNTDLGILFGYVDVMFAVQPPPNMAEDDTLYVYIDPSSHLVNTGDVDVISAIRISVTIPPVVTGNDDPDLSSALTYVFGSERKLHYGISTKEGYIVDGQRRFTEVDGRAQPLTSVVINGASKNLTELYPGNDGYLYPFGEASSDIILAELKKGQIQYINVRIWAEGEDDACTPDIAGESFDLLLKFSAMKESDMNKN